jgi:NADH:ubiquinone oxidoreductase subunit 3 (subunit A)
MVIKCGDRGLDTIISPIIVFFLAIIAAGIIWGIGGKISPKPPPSDDKLKPYACGEDMPPVKLRLTMNLYNYATMFLILDVIAVVIVLSMGIPFRGNMSVSILSGIYLAIAAIAAILIFRRGEIRKL